MSSPARSILAILALAAIVPLATAADYSVFPHWLEAHGADDQLEITSVAMIDILGQPYVLATTPLRGLLFYRPTADGLELVNDFHLGGREVDAAVVGYNAYVAGDGPNPLLSRVLIASPTSPAVIWQEPLPLAPKSVCVDGDLAFLACGGSGLLVFDLTEAFGHPAGVVGQWNGYAEDAMVVDGLLYVVTPSSLKVLDVSDPAAPVEVNSVPLIDGEILAMHQGRVVTGGGYDQLNVFDVSDPAAPQFVTTVEGGAPAVGLASSGDELYVASPWDYRVFGPDYALRWAAPAKMDWNRCLAVGEGLIVLGTDEAGLHVFADGAHTPIEAPEGNSCNGYNPQARQLVGNLLYVTAGQVTSTYRVDTTPPLAWVHTAPGESDAVRALDVAGDRAFIGYSTGLIEVLDVSGPQPVELGAFTMPGAEPEVHDLAWTGSVLAVLWDPDGNYGPEEDRVSTVDLAGLEPPVVLDSVVVGYEMSIHAVSDVLAVWSLTNFGTSVQLIDASDPTDLRLGGSQSKPPFSRVTAGEEYLYVSVDATLQALRIVSADQIVAGPVQAVPVDNTIHRFHRVGDVGYLSQADMLYDLSDPLVPRPIGSFSTPEVFGSYSVFASTEHLVLMNYDTYHRLPPQGSETTGIDDADPVPDAAAVSRLQAAPNPFNPSVTLSFVMPRAGTARLEVFDARGRRVLARELARLEAGQQAVVWDGRDAGGHAVASGTYLARVRGDGVAATAKVMLAK